LASLNKQLGSSSSAEKPKKTEERKLSSGDQSSLTRMMDQSVSLDFMSQVNSNHLLSKMVFTILNYQDKQTKHQNTLFVQIASLSHESE
tara:strand:- start:1295 stop:1561 length:267 start_codon:yes stop_codon:yes gene_type:complete